MTESKETATLYLVEQARFPGGDVSGCLLDSSGEHLYSHMSSSMSWLENDLTRNFGRADELAERFGGFRLVKVTLDDDVPAEIEHVFGSDKPAGVSS